MASGLQCPGCGHVHPAGLPEIVRGDATFRCYGCYRMLSVPEGWTGRPAPRPASEPVLGDDAPAGAGTRDARRARLAGRRGGPAVVDVDSPAAGAPWSDRDLPTEVVSTAAGESRRPARPLRAAVRAVVWIAAFVVGGLLTAVVLRELRLVTVNTAIDLYAGSGARRFAVLLVLLPLWALLSATIAHFSLEALARRRRPRPRAGGGRAPAETPVP